MPATGIIRLYYEFLDHLAKPENANRIAPLQLAGKIEDYLTKEFTSFIHTASGGSRYVVVNSGLRGEPKIDMAVLKVDKGQPSNLLAEHLLEVKFFRNRHRISEIDGDAEDEFSTALRDFRRQLAFVPGTMHGYHGVRLRARVPQVYGLALVSYTRRTHEPDRMSEYFKRFRMKASKFDFRYHDLPQPYLRSAFEEVPVEVLGQSWVVTLKVGLWKLRTP